MVRLFCMSRFSYRLEMLFSGGLLVRFVNCWFFHSIFHVVFQYVFESPGSTVIF